jgi:predicted glutamine amidotransferase
MCGIVGYIGNKKASPILINGLLRLEYRGYDSAGIATIEDNKIEVMKNKGRVNNLYQLEGIDDLDGTIGIAHTRWATHGKPSKENSHPHMDNSNSFAVVHNGIIENYNELKSFLKEKGYKFLSATDTEVIPNLIHYYYSKDKKEDDELDVENEDRYLKEELQAISEKNQELKDIEETQEAEEDVREQEQADENQPDETDENEADGNDNLEAYREIWGRDFKVSDDFLESFPLIRMFRLFRFSLTPEQYILNGLQIGSSYFGWENAAIYISQSDEFINFKTGEKLDMSTLNIVDNPQMHGVVHIPLYPYSKTNLFGFLEFHWDKDENLVMSDILYFLKVLFSNEIKTIFTNQKNNRNLKSRLNEIVEVNDDVTIAFLEVDDRYKLLGELSEDEANILNMKISDDIMQEFVGYVVFEVFPFIYGLCENSMEDVTKDKLKNFLAEKDEHNYFISPSRGNIAVTFSAGVSSKKGRDIDIQELIEEAECGLDLALDHGGNWINSFGEI